MVVFLIHDHFNAYKYHVVSSNTVRDMGMKHPRISSFLCLLLALFIQPCLSASQDIEEGIYSWEKLHEDLNMCKDGKQQSPIDVNTLNLALDRRMGSLTASYHLSMAVMKNNGYYITVEWPNGGSSVAIDGKNYTLRQCHWHSPSEHTLDGNRFPLELHIVHQSSNNETAVIGIIYTTGQPDPFLSPKLARHLHRLVLDPSRKEESLEPVLPPEIEKDTQYFRYPGSLTTPPCTEGVVWILVDEVRTVSQEQLDLLRAAVHGNDNARAVQPLNGRIVSWYKSQHEDFTSY